MATIISPLLYEPFVQQALISTPNLISMGFVDIDTAFDMAEGDFTKVPYHNKLTSVSANNNIEAGTTLTPTEVDDFEIQGVTIRRGDSQYETQVDASRRGSSALLGIKSQVPQVAMDYMQDDLVATINGAFDTGGALASTNTVDITSIGDGTPELQRVDSAVEQVMGENGRDITGYIVNSKTESDLKAIGLVEYVNAGTFGENILYNGRIPTYNGRPLLVNNTLCAVDTTTTPDQYAIYAVGGKPFWISRQLGLNIKEDNNILIGGGKDYFAWYQFFGAGVKGVSYTGTAQPSAATLATVGNWSKKWATKDIKIVKIITNKLASA